MAYLTPLTQKIACVNTKSDGPYIGELVSQFIARKISGFYEYFSPSSPEKITHQLKIIELNATQEEFQYYVSAEYVPRYEDAEKEISQLSPDASLSKPLELLHSLSMMERGIEKWKTQHHVDSYSTELKVHALYKALFRKVNFSPAPAFSSATSQISPMPRLANPSLTNCFLNVVLHTLFYDVNIAKMVVFSQRQPLELQHAYLEYQQTMRKGGPIDLASSLRKIYPSFQAAGQHDVSEALLKILEPINRHSPLYSNFVIKTFFNDAQKYQARLKAPFQNGCLAQDAREVVYVLEVDPKKNCTLEDLVCLSLNEDVVDSTPVELETIDGKDPVKLRRIRVETRYTSAPKYLIYNLSFSQYLEEDEIKINTLVGVQREFYLLSSLTLDKQGAKYRLSSYNVHLGDTPSSGHYLHYREVSGSFFCFNDDQVKKISELEYLLEAQKAYTIVFEKVDQKVTPQECLDGYLENQAKFSAMRLLSNMIAALNGATGENEENPTLLEFMRSLLYNDTYKDSFSALSPSWQGYLLSFWSKNKSLDQIRFTLENHTQTPFILPKKYQEEIFQGQGSILLSMLDLIARSFMENPKQTTSPDRQELYSEIIKVSGTLTIELAHKHQEWILIKTSLIREVGQVALSLGLYAFENRKNPKEFKWERFTESADLISQALSSLTNMSSTYFDPWQKNPYIQFATRHIQTGLQATRIFKNKKKGALSYAPLISPAIDVGSLALEKATGKQVSQKAQALTSTICNLSSTYAYGSTHEHITNTFSTTYSYMAPIVSAKLQGETNPLHFHTTLQAVRSNAFHILLSNISLQSLVTQSATTHYLKRQVAPLQSEHQKKYQELENAIEAKEGQNVDPLLEEINALNQKLQDLGADSEQKPYAIATKQKLSKAIDNQKELQKYLDLYTQLINSEKQNDDPALISELKAQEDKISQLGIELPVDYSIYYHLERQKKIIEYNERVESLEQAINEECHPQIKELRKDLAAKQEALEAMGVTFTLSSVEINAREAETNLEAEISGKKQELETIKKEHPTGQALASSKKKVATLEQELARLEATEVTISPSREVYLKCSLPPEPKINPHIERKIHLKNQELKKANDDLVEAKAGVDVAQAKVKEKFDKSVKAKSAKECNKADKHLAKAHANLKSFEDARDAVQTRVNTIQSEINELTESLYSPAPESPKLPYPSHVPALSQPITFSLSMQSNKSKEHKEYFVYSSDTQGNKRQIGKFSSKEAAQDFFNKTNDYISGINKQNQERAEAKSHYYSQGLSPDDVTMLHPIEPIYIEISACGSKTNVYQGDQKVFKGKGEGGRNDGLTKAKKLMHQHLSSSDQQTHDVKTKMAEKIFSSPTIPDRVKEAEFNRITHDQSQHVQELDENNKKHESLGRDIPKAKKRAEKDLKNADDTWLVDHKKERRFQDSLHAFKQIKTDQGFTGDTSEQIQKKIEDNNFLLQIAQGKTSLGEVNQVKQTLLDKTTAKNTAVRAVQDRNETFQKIKEEKDHKKVKQATKQANQSVQDYTQAYNRYYELQGVDHKIEAADPIKAPKKATKWEKTKAWVNNNVSASGEVNVVTFSGSTSNTAPSLVHVKTENNQSTRPSHGETRHQIDLERGELPNTQSTPPQKGDWQNVKQLQTQQIFESNMSFGSNLPSQPKIIDSLSSTTLPPELFFRTPIPAPQPQPTTPQLPSPSSTPSQFQSSLSHVQALQNQQTLDSSDQPKDSIVQKISDTTSLLAKATPLIGPIPAVVIKFAEHFKQEKTKTTGTLSSVSPGLLLAPPGLNRQSLSLLAVDFSAVERTLVENPSNPHYAIEELGRQLTNSTEFSEKTKQWVQTTCFELNQFVHQYASEMGANPIQGKMETVAGIFHGLGSCGKDLVNLQAYISLGPFYSIEEIQGALREVDSVCNTVGNHYTKTIQTINPQFNPESAAFKTGHFVGKYVLPLVGPGFVKKAPLSKAPKLTEKAAEVVSRLESRLAQNTERLFAKNPMPAAGSSSLRPTAFTEGVSTTVSRSNAKKPIPKTSQTVTTTEVSATKPARELRKPEDVYAPNRNLPQTSDGVPIPDADVPHTQLGEKLSKKTKQKYVQAREFDELGNPTRDIHFTDHGRPHEHPNPHQHIMKENPTGGTLSRGDAEHLSNWSYE